MVVINKYLVLMIEYVCLTTVIMSIRMICKNLEFPFCPQLFKCQWYLGLPSDHSDNPNQRKTNSIGKTKFFDKSMH